MLAALVLAIVITSPAQGATPATRDPQTDSAAVRAALERAQRDFERLRRRFLPLTLDGGPSPCPERVGRFCTWPEDPEDDPGNDPPEHERIVAERERLLRQLDSAATLLPGDGWIWGQRVRYLLDARRAPAAASAVAGCRAEAWWCDALHGLVAHTLGAFPAADSLFERALAAAPKEVRCRWTDLTVLLDAAAAETYRKLDCEARHSVNDRLWWLADPLWLVPGNERRTAHFARSTYAKIFAGTAVPHGIPWREDNAELLIRFGVPVRWERTRTHPATGQASVVGHRSVHGRSFLPPGRFLDSRTRAGAEPWPPDGGRESFQPPYAREFVDLTAETAVFRRDDEAIIVTAIPTAIAPGAHGRGRPTAERGVFLSVAPDTVLAARSVPGDSVAARFALVTGYRPGVLSVEMLDVGDSVAARSRRWLDLEPRPPGLAISDLLLVRSDSTLPATLEAAVGDMRGNADFRAGETVSLFWEVYHPPVREPVTATLVVEPRDRGFLRKAAEWLGLAGRDAAVEMVWTVSWATPVAVAPGGVMLELPPGQDGRFLLILRIDAASGTTAESRREITIGG